MPDLIAQGSDPSHRWRRTVEEGHAHIVGRAAGTWSVPWDQHVSRRHAQLVWRDGALHVELMSEARNPIYVRGIQRDRFALQIGEHFVIGLTTFTLSDARVEVSVAAPAPLKEQTFSAEYLHRSRFRHADQRIEVLSRLPEIITGTLNDMELFVRLVNVLLAGIPGATAVAIVALDADAPGAPIRVLHWDRRVVTDGGFSPSERLIRQAVQSRQSVVHSWQGLAPNEGSTYTQSAGVDWAYCTPVPGESCRGWGLYVSGKRAPAHRGSDSSDPQDLRDDLKFTELAATTLSSMREARLLERRQASLRQFFSPIVLEALAGHDPDVALAPQECDVTVMFCDLRGFSRRAEQEADDLLGLLKRVSRALGIVTHHILEQGGVVGDFHGDAAMGFWGWPIAQGDAVERACRAALGIRRDFASIDREDPELADFRVGIGIATGRAVSGKIGTIDQVKVTVFGPVVNLASRLETMTRALQAAILMDERTASAARGMLASSQARVRRVAKVKPFGLNSPLVVSELRPSADEDSILTDEHLATYEQALDAFLAKDWSAAFQLLHRVPADDLVKDFLTVYIARHNRSAPESWDGVIALDSK
ncbi:MAG: adenylate/guanylate cyclase domain-containing protein [Planctomycetes bacterium]|nr:adenylate/guanylate cyclase domain-containing protein [Planctomycetota bacterium]